MSDAGLLELVRDLLEDTPSVSEKRMFGGTAFLCGGNLFLGVRPGRFMVRVGLERYEEALALPPVRPMVNGGRSMRGYVFVDTDGLDEDELREFVRWGAGVAAALPKKTHKPVAKKRPAKKQRTQ